LNSNGSPIRAAALLLSCLALAGCLGGPRSANEIARYDFGPQPVPSSDWGRIAVRHVEVKAPSWLDTPALQYRLLFADAAQRHSYSSSRWSAPPAELVEASLRRQILSRQDPAAKGGCSLRIALDEMVHAFAGPQRSEGVVDWQASLAAPAGNRVLARQRFTAAAPAPSADARGGVDAMSRATNLAIEDMRQWLLSLDRGGAAGLNIAEICSGA
jgi:cholesterol transport system auxiliary component